MEILCGLWPAARRRLVWLVFALAVVIAVLTPITTEAGGWLFDQERDHSAILVTDADRGGWMIYFSVAMLIVAIALVVVHWLEGRSNTCRAAVNIAVAVVALAVGISSIVTVVRIGESGARAVWGGELTKSDEP